MMMEETVNSTGSTTGKDTVSSRSSIPSNTVDSIAMEIDNFVSSVPDISVTVENHPSLPSAISSSSSVALPTEVSKNITEDTNSLSHTIMNPGIVPYLSPLHQVALLQPSILPASPMITTTTDTLLNPYNNNPSTSSPTLTTTTTLSSSASSATNTVPSTPLNPLLLMATNLLAGNPLASLSPNVFMNGGGGSVPSSSSIQTINGTTEILSNNNDNNNVNNTTTTSTFNPYASVPLPGTAEYFLQLQQQMTATAALMASFQQPSLSSAGTVHSSSSSPSLLTNPTSALNPALFLSQLQSMFMSPSSALFMNNNNANNGGGKESNSSKKKKKHKKHKKESSKDRRSHSHSKHRYESSSSSSSNNSDYSSSSSSGNDRRRSSSNSKHRSSTGSNAQSSYRSPTSVHSSSVSRNRSSSNQRSNFEGAVVSHYASLAVPSVREKNAYESKLDEMIERYGAEEGDRPPPQPEDGSDSEAEQGHNNNRYISPHKPTDYTRRSVSSSLLRMVSPRNNSTSNVHQRRSPSVPTPSLLTSSPSTGKPEVHPPQEGEGSRQQPFILTPRSKSKQTSSSSSSSSLTSTTISSGNPKDSSLNFNVNVTESTVPSLPSTVNPSSYLSSTSALPFPGLGLSLPLPPLSLPLPLPLPSLLPNMLNLFNTNNNGVNNTTTTHSVSGTEKKRSPSEPKSPKEPRRSLSQHSTVSSISLGETTGTSMTGTTDTDSFTSDSDSQSGSRSSSPSGSDNDDNDSLPDDILEAVASGKGDDPEIRKAIKRYHRIRRQRRRNHKDRNEENSYQDDVQHRRSSSVTIDNRLPLKSALKSSLSSSSYHHSGTKDDKYVGTKGIINRGTSETTSNNSHTLQNRDRERSRSNVRFAVPDGLYDHSSSFSRRDTQDKSNIHNKRSVSVDIRGGPRSRQATEYDRSSQESSLSSHSRSSSVPTYGRSQSVPADHRANQVRSSNGLGGLGGLLGLSSFGSSKPAHEPSKTEKTITVVPESSSSSAKEIKTVSATKPAIRRSSSVPMDIELSRKSSPSTTKNGTVNLTSPQTKELPTNFDSFIRSDSSPKILKKNDANTNDTPPSSSSANKLRISKSVPRDLSSARNLHQESSPLHSSTYATFAGSSPQTSSPFRFMPKSALLGLSGTAPTQLDAKTTRSGRISHKPLEHWKGIHLSSNYEGDTRINVVGVQARTLGSLGSLGSLHGSNTTEVIDFTAEPPEPVPDKKSSTGGTHGTSNISHSSSSTTTTTVATKPSKKESKGDGKPKDDEIVKSSKKRKHADIASPDKEETVKDTKEGKKLKLSGKGDKERSKSASKGSSSAKETIKVSTPGSAKGKKPSSSSNTTTSTPVVSTTTTTKSSEKSSAAKKAKKKEKKRDSKSKSPKLQSPSTEIKSTTTASNGKSSSANEKDKAKDKKEKGSTKSSIKEETESAEKEKSNKNKVTVTSTTNSPPVKSKKRKLGENSTTDTTINVTKESSSSSSSSSSMAPPTTKEVWNISLPEDIIPGKGKKKGKAVKEGTEGEATADSNVLDYSNYAPPVNQPTDEWDLPQIAALIYSFGAIPFRSHPSFWTDVAKLVPGKNATECKEKWTLLGEEGEDGTGIKSVKENSRKGFNRKVTTKTKPDNLDGMESDTTEGTIGSMDDESKLAKALMNTDGSAQEQDLATLLSAGPGTEAAVSQALGTKGSKRRKDAEKEILLAMAKGQLPIILGHQGEMKNQNNGDIFAAHKKSIRTEASLPRSSPPTNSNNGSGVAVLRRSNDTPIKIDTVNDNGTDISSSIAKSRPRRTPLTSGMETNISSSPSLVSGTSSLTSKTTGKLSQPSPEILPTTTITTTTGSKTRSSRRNSLSTTTTTTPNFGMSGIRAILGENDTSMSMSTPGKGIDTLLISPEASPTDPKTLVTSSTKPSRTSRFVRNQLTSSIPDHDAAYKPLPGQQRLGNAFAEHLKNKSQGGFFEGPQSKGKSNASSSSSTYDIFAVGNGKKTIGPRKKHMGGKVTVEAIISGPTENETGISRTTLNPSFDQTYQRINGRLVLGQQYTLTAEVSPSGTTRFVRKRVDGDNGESDEEEGLENMGDMISEDEDE